MIEQCNRIWFDERGIRETLMRDLLTVYSQLFINLFLIVGCIDSPTAATTRGY